VAGGSEHRVDSFRVEPPLFGLAHQLGFFGIAVDNAGSAYVTGYTTSTDFPTTTGAFDTSLNGGLDASVTKMNGTGSALAYSTDGAGATATPAPGSPSMAPGMGLT
jgi:hypothetical protein